jgi:hypothetical protein
LLFMFLIFLIPFFFILLFFSLYPFSSCSLSNIMIKNCAPWVWRELSKENAKLSLCLIVEWLVRSFVLVSSTWSIGHPWNASFHFSFLILRHSVGLLGRVSSPSQDRYLTQTQNTHRHSCVEWDSNPRSQLSSERRQFMP